MHVRDQSCILIPSERLKPGERGCARPDCARCTVLDLERDLKAAREGQPAPVMAPEGPTA